MSDADLIVGTDLIALLRGRWSIERHLHDLRHRVEGDFSGVAVFAPVGDGVRWREEGVVRFGGHRGPAARRLDIVPAGDRWLVTFADGRPFHPLDLRDGACAVEHHCGADRYVGTYRLVSRDTLEVRWEVTGPRKRQRIVTTYRRSDGTRHRGDGDGGAR